MSSSSVNASGQAAYANPTANAQALLVIDGYACLGAGVRTAGCASGSSLDPSTAMCTDGTQSIMQGTEFQFAFVYPNTTTPSPGFDYPYYLTFFDVDGDSLDDQSGVNKAFFELNAVTGATEVRTTQSSTSTLAHGTILGATSASSYAVAYTTTNVGTTFNVNPSSTSETIPAAWHPGMASFKVGLQ
eukprot:3555768-Prymnesium_polylepis.1